MAKHLASAATVLGFLLVPAAASASTIFATFTGTVTSVKECNYQEPCPDPFGGFFKVGDTITGSFQVDLGQADTQPNVRYGRYPASNASIQVGDHPPYTGGSPVVKILDDYRFPYRLDQFRTEVSCCTSGPIPAADWSIDGWWVIHMSDTSGLIFSNDSLPTHLSLDDFDEFGFGLFFVRRLEFGSIEEAGISGTLTAFNFAVPEPTPGILLLTGLLALGLARHAPSSIARSIH